MKILIFIFIVYCGLTNITHSDEIVDCNKFDKLSKKYIECNAENLKNKTKEKTNILKDKTKNKTKEIKDKIDLNNTKKNINKFKKSKTLSDLFKKKND